MLRGARLLVLGALSMLACSNQQAAKAPSLHAAQGEPTEFTFGVLDGTVLSSENTRGRVTALLFAASYDLHEPARGQAPRRGLPSP
ncbi:MAG: hypothetical protein QM756_30580 [Polyangiaceae bacterium]